MLSSGEKFGILKILETNIEKYLNSAPRGFLLLRINKVTVAKVNKQLEVFVFHKVMKSMPLNQQEVAHCG